jgi:hypothetical protein
MQQGQASAASPLSQMFLDHRLMIYVARTQSAVVSLVSQNMHLIIGLRCISS